MRVWQEVQEVLRRVTYSLSSYILKLKTRTYRIETSNLPHMCFRLVYAESRMKIMFYVQ